MTESHTPGPWRVGDAGATVFGPPNGNPSPATIARVSFAMIPSAEMRANAALIAAAPELLAALSRLIREHDCGRAPLASDWTAAREAIAKAEGRS